MAEPIERRSTRLRKPKSHFDNQISQSSRPSKPSKAPKAVEPPTKPSIKLKPSSKPKPSTKPSTKLSAKPSIRTSALDPIEQLCSQTEGLDIEDIDTTNDKKAKKKAKAEEVARLIKLGLGISWH